MVECAGLENQLGGNSYEGSNPSLSATYMYATTRHHPLKPSFSADFELQLYGRVRHYPL